MYRNGATVYLESGIEIGERVSISALRSKTDGLLVEPFDRQELNEANRAAAAAPGSGTDVVSQPEG